MTGRRALGRTPLFALAIVCVVANVLILAEAHRPQAATTTADPALASLLERAGKYVDAYERDFSAVICEERQVQRVVKASGKIAKTRELRSDLLLVKTTAQSMQSFRDVIEVDGKTVRNHDDRLRKLFMGPKGAAAVPMAEMISQESQRFNIGMPRRGGNTPLFPLRLLHPNIATRFRFSLSDDGLTFEETHLPTLLQYRRPPVQKDLILHGRFQMDIASARVLSAELLAGPPSPVSTSMIVTYSEDPKLKMLVPVRLEERYWEPQNPKQDRTEVSSTFSNFRRFDVAVSESIK